MMRKVLYFILDKKESSCNDGNILRPFIGSVYKTECVIELSASVFKILLSISYKF
jgi:hypothetical protein